MLPGFLGVLNTWIPLPVSWAWGTFSRWRGTASSMLKVGGSSQDFAWLLTSVRYQDLAVSPTLLCAPYKLHVSCPVADSHSCAHRKVCYAKTLAPRRRAR